MAEFAQVDVKEIQCHTPRSHFKEAEIEHLADSILSGGLLRPLIVKMLDMEAYLLIEGDLRYHAAVRAREKNPRRGETVNAFIVTDGQEATVKEQLATLDDGVSPITDNSTRNKTPNDLVEFVTNFVVSSEVRVSEIRETLFQAERKLETRMNELEAAVVKEKQRDLLDLINTLEDNKLPGQLAMYGADKAKIEAICKARSQKEERKFESYQELQAIKGLGAKGLLVLIDRARLYHQS